MLQPEALIGNDNAVLVTVFVFFAKTELYSELVSPLVLDIAGKSTPQADQLFIWCQQYGLQSPLYTYTNLQSVG